MKFQYEVPLCRPSLAQVIFVGVEIEIPYKDVLHNIHSGLP